ncbi:UDP-N-acetylmuramoyl-L-alanyl-D-glutamate--2,6-diaminopimelate ligase [Candidatus Kuenenbacteria bacterium]|nr:UDP-N-acetylmuramoyl-L-alanyl-D-glutamate--2,6-diaminopimelate ligase [Candidatus Kuenenbacteria bacterium]
MLEKILNFGRKIIPKSIFNFFQPTYHWLLSAMACLWYGFPSNKLIVIGVTGTNGKSTTVNLIVKILEEAGFKIGLCSGINFKISEDEWENKTRMTMPGRFVLQKMLRKMVKANCKYAVIEVTSEGLKQNRGLGINFDVAVFTNLQPEHLESHGGFEKYKKAKAKLFQSLENSKKIYPVKCLQGKFNGARKIIISNLDDDYGQYFLKFKSDEKYGYEINAKRKTQNAKLQLKTQNYLKIIKAENVNQNINETNFICQGKEFHLNLLGEFNVYNALAGICLGLSQGIDLEIIKKALKKIKGIPGRMEKINEGQNFTVIIDHAHTPDAFELLYQTIQTIYPKESKIISVFGSAGGIRDKGKRPMLGFIASKYSDFIILTNEDPYDTPPKEIIKDITEGFNKEKMILGKKYWEILDRKEAIEKALSLAQENDIVLILGKGCEPCIKIAKNKKIPWDDRKVVREALGS